MIAGEKFKTRVLQKC